ncbi:hypothetical protein MF672_018295 [Actinomadura sp. ATCC 31491]|uniref:Uncharacterized protein n=1 Tax=Actinomadura luzonensis TaxID=2805427 RepID=A0ABT0FTR4_9ACTN|nr:hypothetical protein [Actinomadura luzonensis]MCK2215727.1 hypothetical protein [Actinomadura luzonensis]
MSKSRHPGGQPAARPPDVPDRGPWRLLGKLMERFLLAVIALHLARRAFGRRRRRPRPDA